MRPWGRATATLAGLLLGAACGSTATPEPGATAALPGVPGATTDALLDSGALDTAASGPAGGDGALVVPRPGASVGSGPTASTAAGGTPGSGGTAARAAAPGLTDTTITVGVLVAVNSGAANAALGAGGVDAGDPRRNAEVVIDDMNASGGIAGRQIVPVFHEFDTTSPEPADAQYQAACEDFTEDHEVFAVMSGGTDSFLECLTKAGVVIIEENAAASDTARFTAFPRYIDLNMALDRVAAMEVEALDAQGYFDGWSADAGAPVPGDATVGIITVDTPSFRSAVDDVLVPALDDLGHAPSPDNIVHITDVRRQQDAGSVAPAISSAVLRFRSTGVTHVLIFESNAIGTLMFANNAESQGYRPRYGVTSGNGIQVLIDAGAYPAGQRNGIVGIGWLPNLDITPAENPDDGPYSNQSRRRCMETYARNGVQYDNANAAIVALTACNSFNLLKVAMERAVEPTPDGFVAAVEGLGSTFESATTFTMRYDADHHDGAAAYRHWAYEAGCGCMRYTSGDRLVP